jgi:hypothetical protein
MKDSHADRRRKNFRQAEMRKLSCRFHVSETSLDGKRAGLIALAMPIRNNGDKAFLAADFELFDRLWPKKPIGVFDNSRFRFYDLFFAKWHGCSI